MSYQVQLCDQIIGCYINYHFNVLFIGLIVQCSFTGIKMFCEHIERERIKTMNSLSKKYAKIGPLIIKIERLVKGTNSGKDECMADYYHHWERKVLESLTNMLLR